MTPVDITTLSPRSRCTPAPGSGTANSTGPVGVPSGSVGAARRIVTAPSIVLTGWDSLQPDRPSNTADAAVTKSLSKRPTARMNLPHTVRSWRCADPRRSSQVPPEGYHLVITDASLKFTPAPPSFIA